MGAPPGRAMLAVRLESRKRGPPSRWPIIVSTSGSIARSRNILPLLGSIQMSLVDAGLDERLAARGFAGGLGVDTASQRGQRRVAQRPFQQAEPERRQIAERGLEIAALAQGRGADAGGGGHHA